MPALSTQSPLAPPQAPSDHPSPSSAIKRSLYKSPAYDFKPTNTDFVDQVLKLALRLKPARRWTKPPGPASPRKAGRSLQPRVLGCCNPSCRAGVTPNEVQHLLGVAKALGQLSPGLAVPTPLSTSEARRCPDVGMCRNLGFWFSN